MRFALPASITQALPTDGPTASVGWSPGPGDKARRAALAVAGGIPSTITRLLARPARKVDGVRLDPFFQLGDKYIDVFGSEPLSADTIADARREIVASAYACSGAGIALPYVQDLSMSTTSECADAETVIGARLYRPTTNDEVLPLLVYLHGGGFATGNLDTHDVTCRYISSRGELAVLSVDYRLAPEHPFPIPQDDCVNAFLWAHEHAADLRIDPEKIAIGGDSAGGNLAVTASLRLQAAAGPANVFALAFVPGTLVGGYGASYESFADGPFLTRQQLDFFEAAYFGGEDRSDDPLAAPATSTDLDTLPPTHIAVAGFDPLRDQGELLAHRMREAGAAVSLRRHSTLIHPFANTVGINGAARSAVDEAFGAMRVGLGY